MLRQVRCVIGRVRRKCNFVHAMLLKQKANAPVGASERITTDVLKAAQRNISNIRLGIGWSTWGDGVSGEHPSVRVHCRLHREQ